jgi:hypothetical protein
MTEASRHDHAESARARTRAKSPAPESGLADAATVATAISRTFAGGRIGSPAAVLGLQPTVGNQAIQRLLVQRNGVETVVKSVTDASDLMTIAIMLPRWDSDDRKKVAEHLGISRFKDLIFVLGEDTVQGLGAGTLLTVGTLGDVGKLAGVQLKHILNLAKRWNVGLLELLRATITSFVPTLDTLRPFIDAAPASDRETATKDTALLALAKVRLDTDTYLGLLPALGVYNPPTSRLREADPGTKWISHMKGDEADVYIRLHLAALVKDAVRAGRKVEGEVSVVGGADFDMAFKRQWLDTGLLPTGTSSNVCNAFVDVNLPKRHIWVHKDRGNAGTVIHEGMHKYADPTLRNELMKKYPGKGAEAGISQLDEGTTEFFTREVTKNLGITRRNYADQFDVTDRLTGLVSNTVLASAYFDGKFDGLKRAYVGAKGPTSDWEALAKAIEEKRWVDAKARL